jgi:argininosuccinate lyase
MQAYARVNRNPLGTVGLAGTSWPLNRARTTHLFGFDAIFDIRNSWYEADAIGALSFVMADLNDRATDLHLWSSVEFWARRKRWRLLWHQQHLSTENESRPSRRPVAKLSCG